ncbi:747741fe-b9b0-4527-9d33-d1795b9f6765 [Thermothielavioides terrestris]|uniref:747741fe-b9b0-4527-9d33-d1795b9f6765 n=1 Tax=Thermothielavioides terrestris TaxID=2587410 RepID=A0A446BAL1_9PEZI|nr:747741fe-b9b0-4527-9d33-d1795b9f6765 [Thermothielavioides terrestris]
MLVDREVDRLDVFGSQVVISGIGGGRVKDPQTGTMIRSKDTSDTAVSFKTAMNAFQAKSLVALIAGEDNPLYPCQPPHPYAVLGYFHITDMWKEKMIPEGAKSPVTVWRMRFEKADLTEPSWWMPAVEDATVSDTSVDLNVKAPVITCGTCETPSKEIFTAGWVCLNHKCEKFFQLRNGHAVDIKSLAYTESFLNERTPFAGEVPSVVPPLPDHTGLHGTEISLRRGFVCPDCGCCNRRVYWNRWVCENKDCQYARDAPMLPYPDALLEEENAKFEDMVMDRRARNGVNENPLNKESFVFDPFATIYQRGYLRYSQTLDLDGYLVRQYFLPDSYGQVLGSFSIFSAKDEIKSVPHGPDDLFRTLELTDIGLRRNPAAVFGHKLEGYTRHFQQNFGARYKFGVTVQSRGFSQAPDVILRALHRLIWAKTVAVAASNAFIRTLDRGTRGQDSLVTNARDFNELLALGYMEDDKINYHDDGEEELGPVIAALSLGSPSTMRFRPKRGTGFFLPTHKQLGKVCYKEVLEVPMKHGDMMVMVGTNIQKVYEHTVDPHGKRRFSLTARYIDPEKMTSQADRDDAIIKGAIPAHAQAFVYDGM